ncbi:MAG TPA: alkaline phosphatase family protein [Polyangiaceae bacterium]|nr:alkaline phosphatase family protein [Polyangiaceae bacterium]
MLRRLSCALLLSAACGRTPEPPRLERALPLASAAHTSTASVTPSGAVAPDLPGRKPGHGAPGSKIKHVIVIAMENHDAEQIYADTLNAPYLQTLLEKYAHARNFVDELPLEIPSEGHYVWMEAGTHRFSDALFDDDSPPSASVSTGSNQHLVRQIKIADTGLSWMTYQEGMNEATGACPIRGSGFYVPKHNPFIFFRDVAGDPPAPDTPYCAAHHKPYSALQADLAGELASYVFITPDQCHDMHGQRGCPRENPIRTGDNWLKAELPRLIAYASEHEAVIFITFDEGGSTAKLPFIAIGTMVKPHYAGTERYSHSSQLRSVQLILGLPPLPSVANSNDLSDLFKPGSYP